MLQRAMEIAQKAHHGQTERTGGPYIEHPLRLLNMLESIGATSEALKAVAVLHDVVEDSEVTLNDLAQEFPANIVAGVDAVTRRASETYAESINRAMQHPLGWVIKSLDVIDHLRPGHEDYLPESLIKRYQKALKKLLW